MLCTGLMQNTCTTYSPYNTSAGGTVISARDKDTWRTGDSIVSVPSENFTPEIILYKHKNLTGGLIYTITFLILFAIIRLRGKNIFPLLFYVVAKKRTYETIITNGITQNIVYFFLSLFLSFSVLSIAITYLFCSHFNLSLTLEIFAYLIAWHLLILCIFRLCSWIFNARATGEESIVNLWVYHIVIGLTVSPFVLATFFVETFAVQSLIEITAICLILFYIVKFIRWLRILFDRRVPIFYMILYLCALEVIPLLVLYKLLV